MTPLAPAGHEHAGPRRRRLIIGAAFALVTMGASLLVARRLTSSSWPLDHAEPALAGAAAAAYLSSLVFRARAWHRLFPPERVPRPGSVPGVCRGGGRSGSSCLRLDYLIKVGCSRSSAAFASASARRHLDHLARDNRFDRDAAVVYLSNGHESTRSCGGRC